MKAEELIKLARKAQEKSYSPYSKFKVGAALEMKDGKVILGANIENASYPLSCCAERVAIFSSIMQGYKKEDIVSLTIVADSTSYASPCGACRQVISELLPLDAPIYCANKDDKYIVHSIKELLPFAFNEDDLNSWKVGL